MGGSLYLHKQLTERLIESLGLLEYDSRVFGQFVVRIVTGGNPFGKAINGSNKGCPFCLRSSKGEESITVA